MWANFVNQFFRVALGLFLVGGCASMKPGELERVQPTSDAPRVGSVYLLRGFLGIWSYGIDDLGGKINAAGIRASVFQEDQWHALAETILEKYRNEPRHEPIVLIGHSYGADDTLRIARQLKECDIPVDMIITLDPVTPPKVPDNVRVCYNFYQSNLLDSLPFFRGIPLESEAPNGVNLQNMDLRSDRRDLLEPGTDHFNIEKNEKVHAEIIKKLQQICLPREVWLMQHWGMLNTPSNTSGKPSPASISRYDLIP
jgi:hypothetical protein